MQALVKKIRYLPVIAALGLGFSYFLPFHYSQGKQVVVYAGDDYLLFFWALPVALIIHLISRRWLKATLSFFAALTALLNLFMLTFLATFKRDPLIGFDIAQLSSFLLIAGWLALSILSIFAPQTLFALDNPGNE